MINIALGDCPVCGFSGYVELQPYKGMSPGFVNKFLVECESCHLVRIHPLPSDEEIRSLYSSYWDRGEAREMFPLFREQARARFAFMSSYIPAANPLAVLDIGAGFGCIKHVITDSLKDRAVLYDAVEIDPVAVDYLKRDVKPRNLFRDLRECSEQYDVVLLSHLLEHLNDPLSFLCALHGRVKDTGIIFMEVPNQDYRFKPKNEPHVLFFSPPVLVSLAGRAGYAVQRMDTCGQLIRSGGGRKSDAGGIKGILHSILPKGIIRKIKKAVDERAARAVVKSVGEYGPGRRWIQLVASGNMQHAVGEGGTCHE